MENEHSCKQCSECCYFEPDPVGMTTVGLCRKINLYPVEEAYRDICKGRYFMPIATHFEA